MVVQQRVPAGRTPSGAPRMVNVSALPGREYAVARRNALGGLPTTLPRAFDDLTRDFGDDLYERMMLDPAVRSKFNTLRAGILSGGVHLSTVIEDANDPNFGLAREIRDFCARCLTQYLATPIETVLWEMLEAVAVGNRVAEQVYMIQEAGQDAGKMVLRDLKPKPRWATAFVVDIYNNVLGLATMTEQSSQAPRAGFISIPAGSPNPVIPRAKFFVYSFQPHDGDPRGTSHLRAAYNSWWFKLQVWPKFLQYLAVYAVPSLVGYTAEAASVEVVTDLAGNPDANQEILTPEQEMANRLSEVQSGVAVAFPAGYKVDLFESRSQGEPFEKAITLANREIAEAILHQSLATDQADNQARAAAETHEEIMAVLIRVIKSMFAPVLYREVLKPLVRYNWGDRFVDLTPRPSMGMVQDADMSAEMGGVATLFGTGYFTEEQLPDMDRRLGFPARTTFTTQTPTKAEPKGQQRPGEARA